MGDAAQKVTTRWVAAQKGRGALTVLTAYDVMTARSLDRAGVDILLVGDSLGMVVLGLPDTLGVTVGMVAHHTRAVARGRARALLVADMPFLSYHTSLAAAVRNAGRLVRAGAEAVKLEGGAKRVPVIQAILDAEIPVMGHLGLTPQSLHKTGGFKLQGREVEAARRLIDDALVLEAAGVFAIVLEMVPEEVAAKLTAAVKIPTIGIGAGPSCDGQVLVTNDLLGLGAGSDPRFVRRYAELGKEIGDAVARYVADVRAGTYPGPSESFHLNPEVARALEEP